MSKLGKSIASRAASNDDHIVLETRRLLNALNTENAELKHQNNILNDRLRDLDDRFRSSKEEKQQLEEDMKQINFSLMQQLKNKGGSQRDMETQLDTARNQVRTLEEQLRRAGTQQDNLLGEIDILRERVQTLEAQSQATKRQGMEHSARQSKFEEERALLLQQREESERQLASMTHHRDAAMRLVDEERQRSQSIQFELDTYRETVSRECASLVATAKRTEAAESEALFAHNQMANLATHVAQYFTDLQLDVRSLSTAAVETEGTLAQHLQLVERLKLSLAQVVHEDEAVMQYLRESWLSARAEVDRAQQETKQSANALAIAEDQVSSLQKQNKALQADIQTLESALDELESAVSESGNAQRSLAEVQQTNRTLMDLKTSADKEMQLLTSKLESQQQKSIDLESKLQQSERARVAAEDSVGELQKAFFQFQERSAEMVQQLQDECRRLQHQLDDQVDLLSGALGRLSTSSASRQPSLLNVAAHGKKSTSRSVSSHDGTATMIARPQDRSEGPSTHYHSQSKARSSREAVETHHPMRAAPTPSPHQSEYQQQPEEGGFSPDAAPSNDSTSSSEPLPNNHNNHYSDNNHNNAASWKLDERLQQAMMQRAMLRPSKV